MSIYFIFQNTKANMWSAGADICFDDALHEVERGCCGVQGGDGLVTVIANTSVICP